MPNALRKMAGLGVVGGVVLWWARLMAHSKQPPPEGRWQELRIEEA